MSRSRSNFCCYELTWSNYMYGYATVRNIHKGYKNLHRNYLSIATCGSATTNSIFGNVDVFCNRFPGTINQLCKARFVFFCASDSQHSAFSTDIP